MLVKSKVKYIQSLGQKKQRDEAGEFIAEGPKIVNEFLQDIPAMVSEVFALETWISKHKHLPSHVAVTEVTVAELEKISQLATPNEVLAVVKQPVAKEPVSLKEHFTLVLDTIQDPGNLGTIIRIADWFGLQDIVCSMECADAYNPKVVQASMGSISRMNIWYTSLPAWLSAKPDIRIYAAMLDGQDITQMQKPREGLLIIGNESKGISEELIKLVNVRITIPRKGRAESLNAAVASGILLSWLT